MAKKPPMHMRYRAAKKPRRIPSTFIASLSFMIDLVDEAATQFNTKQILGGGSDGTCDARSCNDVE